MSGSREPSRAHAHGAPHGAHGHGDPVAWDPGPPSPRRGLRFLVAGAVLIVLGGWLWLEGRRLGSGAAPPGADLERARELELQGRLEDAIAAAELAAEAAPRSWEPLAELARLEARAGDLERARAALEQALELAPDEPSLRELAGRIESGGAPGSER